MLSTMVNAYSTSVALTIVTLCDFIAIKIQAENVSNDILNMRSKVDFFTSLNHQNHNLKVTENETHLF